MIFAEGNSKEFKKQETQGRRQLWPKMWSFLIAHIEAVLSFL